MTLSSILRFGDPRLRGVAAPVDVSRAESALSAAAELPRVLSHFRAEHGWGRAIAAPQIGLALRIVAFDFGSAPFLAINPEIVWQSAEMAIVYDDCFSLPEIAAPVGRRASVSLAFLDERLQARRCDALPLDLAELVQHELDHLDGVLFVDRILDPSRIVAREHKPA